MSTDTVNEASAVEELTAQFRRYEAALMANDIAVLDELFLPSDRTIRYGPTEALLGWAAIARFRAARPATDLDRVLANTVITTFGSSFGTASTQFRRVASGRAGKQTQTWLKIGDSWRIVQAHVSLDPSPS